MRKKSESERVESEQVGASLTFYRRCNCLQRKFFDSTNVVIFFNVSFSVQQKTASRAVPAGSAMLVSGAKETQDSFWGAQEKTPLKRRRLVFPGTAEPCL